MTRYVLRQVIREQRVMLVVVILFAVQAIAVWGYLLVVQQKRSSELHALWNEKRLLVLGTGSGIGLSAYHRNEAALHTLLATVPTLSELPRILGQVTDFAALHKASIETLSYKPLPVNGLRGYQLVITSKGSYEAVKNLLADLQGLNTLAFVDSVSLVNPDPQGDQVLLETRMVINFRPEETP